MAHGEYVEVLAETALHAKGSNSSYQSLHSFTVSPSFVKRVLALVLLDIQGSFTNGFNGGDSLLFQRVKSCHQQLI